jgi:arginine N-succinyltransferase
MSVGTAAPGPAARRRPHPVRDACAADLASLRPWLAPGADPHLPAPGSGERWLVATQADGTPLAALRLRLAIGLDRPRHWYHVGCVVHAAPELALFHRLHTLQLGNDHTGACELADIVWQPALDLVAQAVLLQDLLDAALAALARAVLPDASQLIVELPGLGGAAGPWPFWQGLGRRFYSGDVPAAARRFGPAWRSHVAALMPRQPVVTAFLDAPAQAAIAQVAPTARVLMQVLWQAGLRYGHHIGIIDGGPVFELPADQLRLRATAAGPGT